MGVPLAPRLRLARGPTNPVPFLSGSWLCLMSPGQVQLEFTSPSPPCWLRPRNGRRWVRREGVTAEAGPAWSRLSFKSPSGQHISPGEGPRAEEGSLRNWEDTGHSLLGSGGRASAFIARLGEHSLSLWHPVAAAGVPLLLSHHLSGPLDPPLVTCVLSIFLGNAIHSDHFPMFLFPSKLP